MNLVNKQVTYQKLNLFIKGEMSHCKKTFLPSKATI